MPLPSKKNTSLPNLNSNDDIDFKSLDIEEVEELDEQEELIETQELPTQNNIPNRMNIPHPNEENDLGEEDTMEYIDKKKKRIIPIGGSKSLVRANDFDNRKNTLIGIKITRAFVFIVIILLFLLGIKNTYFPEQIYTPDEIEQIAQSAVGDTGFPLERGRAFAEEFLYYYLNEDMTNMTNRQILSKFYNGEVSENTSNYKVNKSNIADNKQHPLSRPILFEEFTPTKYTGVYKFSVLLSDSDGKIATEEMKELKANWLSFSINVYYDKNTDSLAIHPDSPSLIPTYNIKGNDIIPDEKLLGNGEQNESMKKELNSTIDGFIEAYSKVSEKSHSEIDQYIPAEQPVELISGFGGDVKLAKDPKSSIFKTIYDTDKPDEWKVNVKVQWINNQLSGPSSVYNSRYVMTVNKTADDVYLVTKFVPYTFIEKEKGGN